MLVHPMEVMAMTMEPDVMAMAIAPVVALTLMKRPPRLMFLPENRWREGRSVGQHAEGGEVCGGWITLGKYVDKINKQLQRITL